MSRLGMQAPSTNRQPTMPALRQYTPSPSTSARRAHRLFAINLARENMCSTIQASVREDLDLRGLELDASSAPWPVIPRSCFNQLFFNRFYAGIMQRLPSEWIEYASSPAGGDLTWLSTPYGTSTTSPMVNSDVLVHLGILRGHWLELSPVEWCDQVMVFIREQLQVDHPQVDHPQVDHPQVDLSDGIDYLQINAPTDGNAPRTCDVSSNAQWRGVERPAKLFLSAKIVRHVLSTIGDNREVYREFFESLESKQVAWLVYIRAFQSIIRSYHQTYRENHVATYHLTHHSSDSTLADMPTIYAAAVELRHARSHVAKK